MSKPSFGLNIVDHAVIRKVGAKHRLRFSFSAMVFRIMATLR